MIIDFVEFVEEHSELTFYPNAFPLDNSIEAAGICKITPMSPLKAGVATIELQLIVRATHPETAEKYAIDLRKALSDHTAFTVGEIRVIHLTVPNPIPNYIGKDENNRYKYSINCRVMIQI